MFPNRETREGMSVFFWISLTIIAIIVIGIVIWLAAYPAILNRQREATQHSQPYIQSKVAQLSDLKAQYERLGVEIAKYEGNQAVQDAYRAQQKAIIDQMWQTYDLIPEDIRAEVVPNHIRAFLSQHSRVDK